MSGDRYVRGNGTTVVHAFSVHDAGQFWPAELGGVPFDVSACGLFRLPPWERRKELPLCKHCVARTGGVDWEPWAGDWRAACRTWENYRQRAAVRQPVGFSAFDRSLLSIRANLDRLDASLGLMDARCERAMIIRGATTASA